MRASTSACAIHSPSFPRKRESIVICPSASESKMVSRFRGNDVNLVSTIETSTLFAPTLLPPEI